MADPIEDAGNDPTLDAGNGSDAGPNGGEGAAPNADIENLKALNKAQQESVAKANARAAELTAENERLKRERTPAAPTRGDNRQKNVELASTLARGFKGSDGTDYEPDPVSAVALDALATAHAIIERDQIRELADGDKDMAKRIAVHLQSNRDRLGDPQAAYAELMLEDSRDAKAEAARLTAALKDAQAPNSNAPPTHQRSVPASAMKTRTLTEAELSDELRGKSSFERMKILDQVGSSIRVKG